MTKVYVLLTPADQTELDMGNRPGNCLIRDFDSEAVASSYREGVKIGSKGGAGTEVVRESHLSMTVQYGNGGEGDFNFRTVEEKGAFGQAIEDVEGYASPVVYGEDSPKFATLERLFAANVDRVFIRCEEGAVSLLKSFGARLGKYDEGRGGVLADVSENVLAQIRDFPADFEVEYDIPAGLIKEIGQEECLSDYAKKPVRVSTLVFLRYERAQVTSIGLLKFRTTLDSDSAVQGALIDATTEWVQKTEAGRRLWEVSDQDLNIGDLVSSDALMDEVLLTALRLREVEFVECALGEPENTASYDLVLVDSNKLQFESQMDLVGL